MTLQVVAQTQIEIATDPGVGSLEAKIVLIILALLNGGEPGQKAGQVAEQDLLAHLTISGNYSRWQVRRALEVLKGKGYIGREDGQVTVSPGWVRSLPGAVGDQQSP